MTGCEKITAHILEQAEAAAAETLAAAEKAAGELIAAETAASKERAAVIVGEGEQAAARQIENAESAAELTVRSRLLIQRRAEIDAVLAEVLDRLCARPAEERLETVLDLCDRMALEDEGVLWLCEDDLSRLPADFEKTLAARLGASRRLTVSPAPRRMRGGCVLQYGEIELCAAYEALLEEKREELEDLIGRRLFG